MSGMEVALLVSIPVVYVGIGVYVEWQERGREARFKMLIREGQLRYTEIDLALRHRHAEDRAEDVKLTEDRMVKFEERLESRMREWVATEVKHAIKESIHDSIRAMKSASNSSD